jgi:UDPglucose 6-dehydrogenase
MNFIILGDGHVGRPISEIFAYDNTVVKYDIDGFHNKPDDFKPDGIVVCLPTPEREDGSCDYSIIEKVLNEVNLYNVPVLIKSTIDIDAYTSLKERYNITYAPEFLRERHPNDALDTKDIFIGGMDVDFWLPILKEVYPLFVSFTVCEIEELILIKYIRNSYLATKVTFFNEIYQLCDRMNLNYDNIKIQVAKDERIGYSHMDVPGYHGLGYSGSCLPKDVKAFMHMSKKLGYEQTLLNTVKNINDKLRDD